MNSYYGELCTKIYEYDKSLAVGKELEFYLSFVKNKNLRVLEPMCGNGRMLIPFMQEGIDIEGFDISEDMLNACKEKCKKLNLTPKVYQGRIEEFKSNEKYDIIMIPIGSFSLLPDQLVNSSLQNMKSALKENGKLLLTVVSYSGDYEEITEWVETNRKIIDGETIIEYRKVYYNEETKFLNITLKYETLDGVKSEVMNFPIRLYEPGEFETTLKSSGFNSIVIHEVKDGYGDGNSFSVYECS